MIELEKMLVTSHSCIINDADKTQQFPIWILC